MLISSKQASGNIESSQSSGLRSVLFKGYTVTNKTGLATHDNVAKVHVGACYNFGMQVGILAMQASESSSESLPVNQHCEGFPNGINAWW